MLNHASRLGATLTLALAFALAACTPNPADTVPAATVSDTGAPNDAASGSDAASVPADSAAPTGATAPDSAAYPGAGDASGSGAESPSGYPAPGTDGGAAGSGESAGGASGGAMIRPSGDPIALAGTIALVASKVTRSHDIVFQDWTGTLDLGDGSPASAKLAFEVDTASAISDPDNRGMMSDRLDQHLKSDEFLHVEQFPAATFVSTSIVEGGENGATHTITGDLTIRGQTKSITFPATVTIAGNQVSGTAEFSLNRQDFGVAYPGQPDDLVRDEVVMKIDVNGTTEG